MGEKTKLLPWLPFLILAFAAAAVLASLADGASRNLFWDADHAIVLIDMHHASTLHQSLGISSRFGWAHPGPLNYYLLLPLFWATNAGVQSLMLGTAIQNGICFFGAAAILSRLGGRAVGVFFLLAFTWFLFMTIGPRAAWDVLLPFSTILPWVLALCLACAVAIEGFRWTPLLALVLAFLTQAHVSLWLPSVFLGCAGVGLAFLIRRQTRAEWAWLAGAVALTLVLWIPPLLEWSNLTRIFRHFAGAQGAEHSVMQAFRALAVLTGQAVTGEPIHYIGTDTDDARFLLGAVMMLAGLAAAIYAWRTANRFAAVLGALIVGSAGVFVFSLTRYTGPISHHSILFMPALGPLLLILAGSLLAGRSTAIAPALAAAGCLALVASLWQPFQGALAAAKTPAAEVRELAHGLAAELAMRPGKQTVFIDPAVWPIAFGAVAQVYRDGAQFKIESRWGIIFGHQVEESLKGPGVQIAGKAPADQAPPAYLRTVLIDP